MSGVMLFVLGALKITLLDLTLSGDNVGVIALATKNLPAKYAKRATLIGIATAITLIITFACCITSIISLQWLHIKLIGGLLLAKITWNLVFSNEESEEDSKETKASSRFWEAVGLIIIADISMSLDNVLAIAAAANGHIGLIIFGVALNIPIIAFGSQYVAGLMNRFKIVIYLGGAVLAHTSVAMIMEDTLIKPLIPHMAGSLVPWAFATAVLAYGSYVINREKEQARLENV